MDPWEGSSLDRRMWLKPRLCDAGQAINLPDPVPAPENMNKDAHLPGLARGLNEKMHACVITPAQVCSFYIRILYLILLGTSGLPAET